MSINEEMPSPEQILREKIQTVLLDHYHEEVGNPENEYNTFTGYDNPEAVKAILEQGGIDTNALDIIVKPDKAEYKEDEGGYTKFGARVIINSNGQQLFSGFYDDPVREEGY